LGRSVCGGKNCQALGIPGEMKVYKKIFLMSAECPSGHNDLNNFSMTLLTVFL
jgi:hypothetical protein